MGIKHTNESQHYISKLYWQTSNLMICNSEIVKELQNETLRSSDTTITKKSIEDKLIKIFNESLKYGALYAYGHDPSKLTKKPDAKELYTDSYERYSSVLKIEDIKENPYVKNIDLSRINIKKSKIEYSTMTFDKGEMTPYDIERYDEDFNLNFAVGIYDGMYESPTLLENGSVWMNLVPSEFVTMDQPIANAHGNVLVFGLGLGYYQYMISLKDTVDKITIVEKNTKVIKLFEEYILPQFEYKDKITIVKGDVFKVFNSDYVNQFDYCFVDTWYGRQDGLSAYLRLREKTDGLTTKVDYWLEDGFKITVITNMLLYLYLQVCLEAPLEKIADTVPPDAMMNPGSDVIYLKCINYFLSNDFDLSSISDAQKLISDDSIIEEILDFEPLDLSSILNNNAINMTKNLHSRISNNTEEYKWKKKKKKKKKR